MKLRQCLALIWIVFLFACSAPPTESVEGIQVFSGFTLIDGTGSAPQSDSVLVVRDGKIQSVGSRAQISLPEGAPVTDLSGKFVTPGLIVTHGHVGMARGLQSGADFNTPENVMNQLRLYARYGVTAVVSLGFDGTGSYQVKAMQSEPGFDYARLFVAGITLDTQDAEEAVELVKRNQADGADFIKIRVDDQLGTVTKMPRTVYGQAITEAHRLGLKVAAHLYYLEDAKQLLDAGVDFLGHSIRDQPVDDTVLQLFRETSVCLSPTLTRELSTFVYSETPEFFSDPFFTRAADPGVLQALQDPDRQKGVAEDRAGQMYREALPTASQNLARLAEAGVRIAFGTDSGPPARFQGYFEHLEMQMMADAGLSPEQVLRSATRDAADCLGLEGLGTLEPGKWADFVVLDSNPLENVRNFRSLQSTWIGGVRVAP